jgi:hypothetical protein
MLRYGIFSQKQHDYCGSVEYSTHATPVQVTEVFEARDEQKALAYFEHVVKPKIPDAKFVGEVVCYVKALPKVEKWNHE